MAKLNPLDKKCRSDQLAVEAVTNDELVCADCLLRYECSGKCEAYPVVKPKKVFEEGECDEYVKE